MTKNAFSQFVAKEEERLAKLYGIRKDALTLEKKNLALEVLHRLDVSEKANRFKSLIKPQNYYRETRVSLSTEYGRNYIGILLVVSSEEDDLIEIYSEIDEDELRYWAVSYGEKYFECEDIDSLIEYLENFGNDTN